MIFQLWYLLSFHCLPVPKPPAHHYTAITRDVDAVVRWHHAKKWGYPHDDANSDVMFLVWKEGGLVDAASLTKVFGEDGEIISYLWVTSYGEFPEAFFIWWAHMPAPPVPRKGTK